MGLTAGRKGAENITHTGIRSPDRPARSESLYRLNCPGPLQQGKAAQCVDKKELERLMAVIVSDTVHCLDGNTL